MTTLADMPRAGLDRDVTAASDDLRRTLDEVGLCIRSRAMPTGCATVSPTCAYLWAVPPERLASVAASRSLVHPDGRQARADTIRRTRRAGGSHAVDDRVVRPDGQACWLGSRGRVDLDGSGRPVRHRGAVLSLDGVELIRSFGAAAERLSGCPAGEPVARPLGEVRPGIAEAVADRLFQPFVTTKKSGMGVGLSICRTIVEAHGGRLAVERNGAGGATFRLTLQAAHEGDLPNGE